MFQEILFKKNTPRGEYRKSENFSEKDLRQMYAIFEKYYENVNFENFARDFSNKSGAFLVLHPKSGDIVGFSTIKELSLEIDGKMTHAFFSGDTVVEKEFWGTRILPYLMFKYVISFRMRKLGDPIYWLLISKGFKTYLVMANNWYSYYPHYKGKHQGLKKVIDAYSEAYYGDYYIKDKGLLDFGDDYAPLKGDIAPITDEMRQKSPKIKFFEQVNPEWERGTELVCVGAIPTKDIFRYIERFFTKSQNLGKLDAKAAMEQSKQSAVTS